MPRVVVFGLRWLRGLVVEGLCVEGRCSLVEMVEGFGGRGGCVPRVVVSGLRWSRGLVARGCVSRVVVPWLR